MKRNDYQKEVFKKLANFDKKIELKSEVVELGIAQDIKKVNAKGEKINSNGEKAIDRIEKAFQVYNQNWEKVNTLAKEAEQEFRIVRQKLTEAEKAAKELGISPTVIDGYNDLEKTGKGLLRISNLLGSYPSIR